MISVEQQKKILLGILEAIDRYCRENNLTYYLAYGTLLGAVRHKGFIPWDDDIDIWMFRSDYDQFIAGFKDDKTRYKVVGPDNCLNYHLPFGKVIDTETRLVEEVDCPPDLGSYVDIFPIDYLPESVQESKKIINRISFLQKMLSIKKIKISKDRKIAKNFILCIGKALLFPVSRAWLIKKINSVISDKSKPSNFCGAVTAFTYGRKEIMNTELFADVVELEFENHLYYAPRYYHEVLKHFYGEYMKLPPKEKQVTHHSYVVDWNNMKA